MNPAAGRTFGVYRLLRPIAADAISTTYFATTDDAGPPSRATAAQFTVRITAAFDESDARAVDLVRQFLADAQRAAAIDHPSIVRPRDFGVVEGRPYVAAPFVRAVPLGDMLAHGGSINESAALAIFAQLAGGLDAAHRAEVVHGALSPCTIWVGPSTGRGAAYVGYITGFGSSVLLRERLAAEPRGEPLDDLLYVAPEQLRGEPTNGSSDQYALACALFHTLAGYPPFQRDTRSKLYGAHLMATPPVLADLDGAIATPTSEALRRGMDKRPSRRHASCGTLINAALPPSTDQPQQQAGPMVASAPRRGAVRRSRPAWPLVLAGLGVGLVGVVLWFVFARSDGSSATATPPAASPSPDQIAAASSTAGSSEPPGEALWATPVAEAAVVGLHAVEGMVLARADGGTTVALGARDGRVRWVTDVGPVADVAVGGGVVAYGGDALTVLDDRTGESLWSSDAAPTTSLHVVGGTVIGVADAAVAQDVLALGVRDGNERWHMHGRPGGAGAALTVSTGGSVSYILQGRTLLATDPLGARPTAQGRRQVDGPRWEVDVGDAWPVLAATAQGVAVATRDGEVCLYGADDGVVDWCMAAPGADTEQPYLFANRTAVVATTSRAVVALDPQDGAPLWSLSPGSPDNLVAVSGTAVVVVDRDGGLTALDTAEGGELLALADLGEITALATTRRSIVVGTGDGQVRRFDLAETAG